MISIHALLAESDVIARWSFHGLDISIHALLAESDPLLPVSILISLISIHALLAESDWLLTSISTSRRYFYPRSPCGERRRRSVKLFRQNYISIHALLAESDYITIITICIVLRFLSTLSLRRATSLLCYMIHLLSYFYPRSPCGERLLEQSASYNAALENFYPRSPCGERPYGALKHVHQTEISIHALLAESDHDDKY